MFKRKSQGVMFDFKGMARRCAMGDVEAMYQMSKWFRSQLPKDFLTLEEALERAEGDSEKQKARDVLLRYLKQETDTDFLWKASNFWLNRAALYGHATARAQAEDHPRRCLNAFFSPYQMLPLNAGRTSCQGKTLQRLGLLEFTVDDEYDIDGLQKDGLYHAKVYRGYDGPDETGFGMEEEYDHYTYDEFFCLLKRNDKDSLKVRQEERRRYWNLSWNRNAGTPYCCEITKMELQIVRDGKLLLSMGIQNVVVPEGVTEIRQSAFYHNAVVESIVLPDSLKKVEKYAFSGCDSLRQICFSDGLEYLPKRVFFHSHALEQVILPKGLKEIGAGVFLGCHALPALHIPVSVERIGENAFMYCESLEEVILPPNLRCVEKETFFLCKKLSHITLPDTMEHIGEKAFYRCPCEAVVAKRFPHLYQMEEKNKKFLGLF